MKKHIVIGNKAYFGEDYEILTILFRYLKNTRKG